MGWNKRDFVATMECGKARAMRDRNRGLPTGKAAKGWVRGSRLPDQGGPTSEQLAGSYGLLAVELAIEDHMRALYPERYDWPEATLCLAVSRW
jgi:hypothetical protein